MKTKDLETFIRLEKELGSLCVNIFNYVKENYVHKLIYGVDSLYCDKFLTEDGLTIRFYDYGGIMSNHYLPTIPLHLLENDNSWKEFLDEYYGK